MKRRLIALLLAALFPAAAEARDKTPSAEHRKEVEWSFFAHPLTFTDKSVGTAQGVGYKLDPDLWVEGIRIEGASGGGRYSEFFNIVRLKAFLGNSFYIEAGVAQRDLYEDTRYSYDSYATSGRGAGESRFDRTRGVVAGLGNQWQWHSFSIGGEWLGLYHPLQSVAARPVGRLKAAPSKDPLRASPLFMGLILGWAF